MLKMEGEINLLMKNRISKSIISIVLSIVLLCSVFPFSVVNTVAASTSTEVNRINKQIKDTYTEALKRFKKDTGKTSFNGWCGAYVRDQLLALSIITTKDKDVAGNGRSMYGNTKEGKTSTGYKKIKYSGNNCIKNIVSDHPGNVYNILVSWNHQSITKHYSDTNPGDGHVTFIHAIIGGKLYFSESYGSSHGKEGTPQNCSLSTFMSRYNNCYGNARGAVLFTKGDDISYSVTANAATNVTNDSAVINSSIDKTVPVEKWGYYISTNQNEVKKVDAVTDTKNTHKDTSTMDYCLFINNNANPVSRNSASQTVKTMFDSKKKLKNNTTYYYKFCVKINDKWYQSGVNSFKTGNKVPNPVSNLVVNGDSKIGYGSSAVISWKKSDMATSYFVDVWKKDKSYHVSKTLTGVNSTSYQSDILYVPDIYTVSVAAQNSSGSSSSVSVEFELIADSNIRFSSGFGEDEIKSAHYNGSITTPNVPDREGYQFDGWKNIETGSLIQAATEIKNIKEDATYVAQWTPKNYTINIVDGINNKIIKSISRPFDSTFNVSDFIDTEKIAVPEHKYYDFVGYSENVYTVKAETHTIYARYKWVSEYGIGTFIEDGGIKRAKSKDGNIYTDGYSIDVKVTAPAYSNTDKTATDQTIKGRIVVALKTNAGRLLIETESSAFVLYPKKDEEVSKIINVFVPYEITDDQLATVVEAYVVNNYYSAGVISNIASNNEELLKANADSIYNYDSTPVKVGDIINGKRVIDVNLDKSRYRYTLTTTEKKDSLDSSLNGYTYSSSRWSDALWHGTSRYVKEWPSLVSNGGSIYDNTSGYGKIFYDMYSKEPVSPKENDGMRIITKEPTVYSYIYYHWCRNNTSPKTRERAAGYHRTDTFNTFHCFETSWDLNKRTYQNNPFYFQDYPSVCKDTYYWSDSRVTIYSQEWETQKKINTFTKTDVKYDQIAYSLDEIHAKEKAMEIIPSKTIVDNSYPVNSIELYTQEGISASDIIYEYAYRLENDSITHNDKNIIEKVSGSVGADYSSKEATVYIYKSTQVSDFTTEYIGSIVLDENGSFCLENIQTREELSKETGDFTVAVAVKGETNAVITGTIKPDTVNESYNVTFVSPTGETISEQTVAAGGYAVLPDENDIPVQEGYHFVCWDMATDIVNKDMTVHAICDENVYSIVFVDWESKKIEIKKVKYGKSFIAPELPETSDDVEVEWILGDGSDTDPVTLESWLTSESVAIDAGVVTEDMIISARYTPKKVNLSVIEPVDLNEFSDPYPNNEIFGTSGSDPFKDDIKSTIEMEYGEMIQTDVYEYDYSTADIIFAGWKDASTGKYLDNIIITNDMTIYPVYQFAEDVKMPTASVTTGEYTANQTVELSCETENAVIFYSTDGSDPSYDKVNDNLNDPKGVHEYTGPITITKPTTLRFCAMAMGKNNSGTVAELYAVNTSSSGVKYHLVTVYSNLPQEEGAYYQALVKDSTKLKVTEFGNIDGYTFNGFFFDEAGEDEFLSNTDLITKATTLYAFYTPKKYTATFNDSDGTFLGSSTVDYGTSAEAPSPAKEGYVFIGWDSEDYEYLTENKTFTAKYCLESEYATVTLSRATMNVEEGSTLALKTKITPIEMSDSIIVWDTNNPEVVGVNQDGILEFISEGTAVVTVTVVSSGESAECSITVKPSAMKSLFLSDGSVLDIDAQRYLRRIPIAENTVAEIKSSFANDEEKLFFCNLDESFMVDSDLVGTGTVVKLIDGETVLDEIFAIMTGDFDGNGKVQTKDVSMMSKHVLNMLDANEIQMIAVDANGDGFVNVRDCAMISRYIAGKEDLA